MFYYQNLKYLFATLYLFFTLNYGFTQELIFHSGFEPGTTLINALSSSSSDLIGTDSSVSSPNNWVNDLDNHSNLGSFRIQYQGGDTSMRYARLVPDPEDSTNTVLQYWLKHPNVSNGLKGRIQSNIYSCNNITEFSQKVRLYLPNDWDILKNTNNHVINWMTIMEIWNDDDGWGTPGTTTSFRMSLSILKEDPNGSDLTFKIQYDTLRLNPNTSSYYWQHFHTESNLSFSIPTEKWLTLETYYKEGDSTNGKFFLAVTPDGEAKQVIFNITNFTHHPNDTSPNGIYGFNPMKLYTRPSHIDTVRNNGGVLQVYWDDFELWKDTSTNATSGIDTQLACNSYTWIDGNTYTASNTTATDTLINSYGCDSVVTLNLTIPSSIDTSVTLNDLVITANQTGANYQWLDCNSNVPILNAVNNNFVASVNGNYAAIISLDGCSDTTSCVTINNVAIEDYNFETQIQLFPNPTTDIVTLKFNEIKNSHIFITDISGKIIYNNPNNLKEIIDISLKDFPNGTYLLSVVSDKNKQTYTIVKQKR